MQIIPEQKTCLHFRHIPQLVTAIPSAIFKVSTSTRQRVTLWEKRAGVSVMRRFIFEMVPA